MAESSLHSHDIFERDIVLEEVKHTLEIVDSNRDEFLARSKDIVSQQRKFSKIQSKIEKSYLKQKNFDKEEQLAIRKQFNDYYYAIISHVNKIKGLEEENRRTSRMLHESTIREFHQPQICTLNKLPTLPLPSFSGDSTDWRSYFDLFSALVHNNDAYTNAEKFRYLLLTLKNEPYNLIKSIPVSDDNYQMAWLTLITRYDNKRSIASKHIDRILDIECCSERSIISLRNLLNIYQENIKALEAMGFPVVEWNFLLFSILLRKIPISIRKRFELSLSKPSDIPQVDGLIKFIEREVSACEFSECGQFKKTYASSNPTRVRVDVGDSTARRVLATKVTSTNCSNDSRTCGQENKVKHCVKCEAQHSLTKCPEFLNLSPRDRYTFLKGKNVCFNCLNLGHDVKNCKSIYVCRACHRRHHSLIHFESQALPVIVEDSSSISLSPADHVVERESDDTRVAMTTSMNSTPDSDARALSNAYSMCTKTVLLSTALVDVYINKQKRSTIRCIIDTGSQASFITESCTNQLGLKRRSASIPVLGIGENKPVYPRGVVTVCMSPIGMDQPSILVEALILPKLISRTPSVPLPHTGWSHIKNLKLADPNFHLPQPVDMLLGADILSHVLLSNVIKGEPGSPIAINSIFGYLLLGNLEFESNTLPPIQVCLSSFSDDIDLRRFWELESLQKEEKTFTPEESLCESIFTHTHTRDETGRYVVALPFKPDAPPLGESRDIARSRLLKLEARLERNPSLKGEYHSCLQEYMDLNHMELVDSPPNDGTTYYIPHHCVVKEASETTKTRVVFDAGCKSSNGISLNDILLTGPKMHKDIIDVVLKFRTHCIALTADIKQMYRNILVQESDRDYQRILWRTSPHNLLREYRLRTVTFGISSSPYLALRVIKQLALDEAEQFPRASRVLRDQVFVDDIVSGANDQAEALVLQQELIGICQTAGFELRKWHSNSPAILAAVQSPISHGERELIPVAPMERDTKTKVLGLQWDPQSDQFSFSVSVSIQNVTKRAILSQIARIYDPMGWLSPVTVYAKHLMQLLWISGVDWDAPPPIEIINAWNSFIQDLMSLSDITIPRYIFPTHRESIIQLHGFSDASEKAYAACVYVRHIENGIIKSYLLLAKTRVAPISPCLSIPRLELMAALLLAHLIVKVKRAYDHIKDEDIYAWCDSSVVLAWLRSPPYEWKTFISNRTSEILSIIPAAQWRHVPSADNPADAPSRGMLPLIFTKNNTVWFFGPPWLSQTESQWPVQGISFKTNNEKRNLPVAMARVAITQLLDVEIIPKFSSLRKLISVTAFVFRFYNILKHKVDKLKPKYTYSQHITVSEYRFCLKRLIRQVQHYSFHDEINYLSQGKVPSNQLRKLNPFIDEDQILRVGGRLHKSLLPFESKHQMILPKKHPLTFLLIDDAHITHLHAGPQFIQYQLLQKYWIISSRDVIRQRLHRCVRCFRARPVHPQPRMAPLPAVRLKPERPFLKTAVDFAGPFYVRANKVRNAKVVKCYVAVFVCMSVKAIHLEIVSELSTEAFLAALRRFTSRRGLCTDIYSDCGKNFTGCDNYLKDLYQFLRDDAVQSHLHNKTLQQGITWHFQPPYASHFGGLFEAGVKSFKHHFYRVIGTNTLTYDEMHTLLCQIEAVLNSRPLCVLSADPIDPLPLTPSHFLIGGPLTAIPDICLTDTNASRLTRWRWIQQNVQHFWKRWSHEYLHEIQQFNKWFSDRGTPIREGSIVVLREDNLPPLQWRLARVHALHPGTDSVTRVVTLQIGNKFVKRPVVKICPLPLE